MDSMYINDEFMGEMMTTYIHREEKKKLVCQRPNVFIYIAHNQNLVSYDSRSKSLIQGTIK